MESKKKVTDIKEKMTCECGAVVIKNNLKAHLLTKKHLASTGAHMKPSEPARSRSSKQSPPKGNKKIKWQEPDDELEHDELDDDELEQDELEDEDELEQEGLFEDEVMDILELLTQKVDNLINQNLSCSMKELYKCIEILGEKHNSILEQLKRIESRMDSLNIGNKQNEVPQPPQPPQPQRANEKCQ